MSVTCNPIYMYPIFVTNKIISLPFYLFLLLNETRLNFLPNDNTMLWSFKTYCTLMTLWLTTYWTLMTSWLIVHLWLYDSRLTEHLWLIVHLWLNVLEEIVHLPLHDSQHTEHYDIMTCELLYTYDFL